MPTETQIATTEILLLEKVPSDVAVIQEAIQNNNLNVVTECPEIVQFLRHKGEYQHAPRPDLILLDLDLSITEDCEVLTEIKKDSQFKRIPVVVIASSGRYEDVFQAYDLHANAYITKPADRKELVKILRATLHFWLSLVRLPKQ
ncbi:MAG: response regulator [Acidobacteriaceae bacterium]|nr:response regulator [Acidobacteriaceae bacterium]